MDKFSVDLDNYELQQLEQCLHICSSLRNALENDKDEIHHILDGDVYEAYSKVVKYELELLNEMRRILLILRENAMLSGDI